MKKIFSAILAVAMVASTMVTAFANTTLNANLSNNKNGKTLKAGDTINVTVTLADAEFANFEFGLNYDASAFEFVKGGKASSSNIDGAVVFGNPSTGYVTGVYANAEDETLEVEVEDEESGEVSVVAAKNTFYWQFKVTANAYSGTYDFTLVQNDEQKRGTSSIANGALTTVLGAPTSATVEGIVVEEETPYAIAEESKASEVVDGFYTQGFKAVVTPNDDVVNAVNFTLDNGTKTYADGWTGLTLSVPATYAINVLNVPADQTVTCDWAVVVAE